MVSFENQERTIVGLQKQRRGIVRTHLRVVVKHSLPLVELHESASQVSKGVPKTVHGETCLL